MSSWIAKLLDEATVLWAPPVRDGLGGNGWAAPIQLSGRWEYSIGSRGPNIQYLPDGTLVEARTSVWVSQLIEVGSYLWKGLIIDIPGGPDPPEGADQVITIKNVRSIPNTTYLYKAYLDG